MIIHLKDMLPQELKDKVLARRGKALRIEFAAYTYVRVILVYYLAHETYIFKIVQRIKNM